MMAIGALGARKDTLQRALETAAPAGSDSDVNRYVKMTGVVQTLDSVVVREPLLNQPCAWFSIRAHKYMPGDEFVRDRPNFRSIGSKHGVAPFLVVNEKGSFLIEPTKARMYVPFKDEHWEGRYRAKMASIGAGDRLTVIGEVQRLHPPADGRVFELVGTAEAPLVVTTFTEGEILKSIARGRVKAVVLFLVGAGLLLLALLA
jgi:hypothetical protein